MPLIKCPACPQCGGKLNKVVMSRRLDDGTIVRRRTCETCQHRWYSQQAAELVVAPTRLQWDGRRLLGVLGGHAPAEA
jgi:transcriptional regulator NrdR family protein